MKHEKIDDKARVWMISRGTDGGLEEQIDPRFLDALGSADTAEEVADVLATTAGRMEIAQTRAW
jgi:hypothetical protein